MSGACSRRIEELTRNHQVIAWDYVGATKSSAGSTLIILNNYRQQGIAPLRTSARSRSAGLAKSLRPFLSAFRHNRFLPLRASWVSPATAADHNTFRS